MSNESHWWKAATLTGGVLDYPKTSKKRWAYCRQFMANHLRTMRVMGIPRRKILSLYDDVAGLVVPKNCKIKKTTFAG